MINRTCSFLIFISFLGSCLLANGQQADNEMTKIVYFQDVRVFDGKRVIEKTNVLIQDGKIASVGTPKVPAQAVVIAGEGMTLIPGLIDSHTHTYFASQLVQAACFGVTTELDMMSMPDVATQLRRGGVGQADYLSAGSAVTVANGHGTQFGFAVPTLANPEEAEAFINDRIREGSDYIKIIYDNGEHFGGSLPTLSKEMLKAAINAAHSKKKMAVCHIGGFKEAKEAIELGADGLVHFCADELVTDEFVEMVVEKKQFVAPTASVISSVVGHPSSSLIANHEFLATLISEENLSNLQRTFPQRAGSKNSWETFSENIKRLHEAGATILAGTDAPNPGTVHGASMLQEIILLSQAGLGNRAALQAATANPAHEFGLKDRGRIQEGMLADLVLIKGNPLKEIGDIRNVFRVWKSGHEIDINGRIKTLAANKARAIKEMREGATEDRLISDFDDGEMKSGFGAGWAESTDVLMGGDSTVKLAVIKGGAEKSSHSLKVTGTCRAAQPAFSGVMYSPGNVPMQKANVSAFKSISFWAKGDGSTFNLMLFFEKRGFMPSTKTFETTDRWQEFKFPIGDFDGCDGTDVLGVFFGAGEEGEFEFQIDNIQLLVE